MSILKKFSESNFESVQNPDVVGGGYSPLDTGVYEAIIKNAYLIQSQGGAYGLTIDLSIIGDQVQNHKEAIYISNRNGENYYINKNSGQKSPLPGFMTVNELCYLATGKPVSEQEPEGKMVNIYDFDLGKEIPKEVPVITELSGFRVQVAIQKVKQNKQEKTDEGYVPTEEIREFNQISKFLDEETGKTWFEQSNDKESTYKQAWLNQWEGKVLDKTTASNRSRPAPAQAGKEKVATKSLFN